MCRSDGLRLWFVGFFSCLNIDLSRCTCVAGSMLRTQETKKLCSTHFLPFRVVISHSNVFSIYCSNCSNKTRKWGERIRKWQVRHCIFPSARRHPSSPHFGMQQWPITDTSPSFKMDNMYMQTTASGKLYVYRPVATDSLISSLLYSTSALMRTKYTFWPFYL